MTDDELAAHRSSIDEVDAALVRLLAERFRITHAIGVYKANNDLPPVDLVRQHQQVEGLRRLALDEGLDPDFCERFLHFVMDEVIRNHRRIAEAASEFTIEQESL
ncbi:MAG: chorismate mutase [Acidimicrobiaceae bacterium]|uniref:chorismate mutase n=1 Tax=Candidatus Poriferisodalis multihospitum TaxID=2983191 RepID=UPI001381B5E9|nr:chorismate mutase [Candidatus Poriferisodalis multihospitum]MCY3608103.1 chorismate mutase [Acidimicrobiaceae bacterium]MXV88471.1 chorismate mutase [Acidimicrobiales bacterium]MCY3894454.1 chorismate mutase [Acidimicrobiaceae bacterium]MCY3950157.1 chorismate mutase [Acidimicrobiaceae bacterium]MDE0678228.1 chorismate mutase [Acidimicrobiaceae bacterium]